MQAADPLSADARGCLAAYAAELRERFPEGFDKADLVRPQGVQGDAGAFLVAYEDGCPVGCGALRVLEPGAGEIRHVWVAAGTRGLGVGRRLLAGLEREAAARGLGVVQLGTHRALTEAVQMYRSSGYTEIPQYGHDPHTRYWFEKRLSLTGSAGLPAFRPGPRSALLPRRIRRGLPTSRQANEPVRREERCDGQQLPHGLQHDRRRAS